MRITRTIIFGVAFHCRLAISGFLILSALLASGQFQEDFSDGDFTLNPTWTGDTAHFSISYSSAVPTAQKPALKLDAAESGTSFLTVGNTLAEDAEWRFWIKLSFNTSGNNFARFYLISDKHDLSGELNGYFVQIGGVTDSIGLFRQTGSTVEEILHGATAFTGNSTNTLRIKVTRDGSGQWQLYADQAGGYNFQEEGICQDPVIPEGAYSGIFCQYTSSNSTKFYFDDFYAGGIYADTVPPAVNGLEVLSSSMLGLHFSEAVEQSTSEDSLHYLVNGGIGHPFKALRDPTNPAYVFLHFDAEFEEMAGYFLQVSDIKDYSGNAMGVQSIDFVFSPPLPVRTLEVIINEIMADVNPGPSGIPAAEYIELYNRTDFPADLSGGSVKPRESAEPIPLQDIILPPAGFLLLTRASDTSLFEGYGPAVGLSGFDINNEGQIELRNHLGELIHSVEYSKELYQDDGKEDGGWSLELVDPGNPCAIDGSWTASVSPDGGTPGHENSVLGINGSKPEILSVELTDPYSLELTFSHVMDSASVTSAKAYYAGETHGHPTIITIHELKRNEAILVFDFPFPENEAQYLEITDTIRDCCENHIVPGAKFPFVRPGAAAAWEIVINEVMADPDPPAGLPGHEYIELFNTTDRYLQMAGWTISVEASAHQLPDAVIGPNEYLILAGDEEATILSVFARTLIVPGISLPNAGATLTLWNGAGVLMAACGYSSTMYPNAEQASGGYSLEQVDPFSPCMEQGNWAMTESDAGGTPGTLNSVDGENQADPGIVKVIVCDSSMLEVTFNTKLSASFLVTPAMFSVDPGYGNPDQVRPADSLLSRYHLIFNGNFEAGIEYQLSVTSALISCTGNQIFMDPGFVFGVPEIPERNDLVINEILFNPAGDGVDFVEIYNRSEKIINLDDLMIGTVKWDPFGKPDTTYKNVTAEDRLLLKSEYAVFTKDPAKVQEQYACGDLRHFSSMESFPAYGNESGTVVLSWGKGKLIDCMDYSEEMHHPLLNSAEGVSLERINPHRSSGDLTNWHSAGSAFGYATPALQNSQYSERSNSSFEIWTEPAIFSPDNDGLEDVVNINYQFPRAGYMASITIFDADGRPVRYLVNNDLLGTCGSYSWDGITENNEKANIGIYVIYFEAFNPDGHMEKQLRSVVLAGRLD